MKYYKQLELLRKRKALFDKIGKQRRAWTLFGVVTISLLVMLVVLLGDISNFISHDTAIILSVVICVLWWFWTTVFIINSVRSQLEIYEVITEISQEVEVLRKELAKSSSTF